LSGILGNVYQACAKTRNLRYGNGENKMEMENESARRWKWKKYMENPTWERHILKKIFAHAKVMRKWYCVGTVDVLECDRIR
jgi:hypothetical protein